MRKLIATVFNYSLDGLLADEGTEFWTFCFDLPENREPDNPAQLHFLESAYAHIMTAKNSRHEWTGAGEIIRVPCFDFSSWLRRLGERPVVKLDIEGAEFPILERLHEDGTDALVAELLVEWHDEKMADFAERKATLLSSLRCPIGPWEEPRTTIVSAIRSVWKSRRAAGAR